MSAPRRKFDREFKREAVKLATRGDKSLTQVARDLGISTNVLSRWKRQLTDDPAFAFPGKGHLKPANKELRCLKKELRDVAEERFDVKKVNARILEVINLADRMPEPLGNKTSRYEHSWISAAQNPALQAGKPTLPEEQ